MLRLAILFAIIAIVAGALGFYGLSDVSASFAKFFALIFLVLFVDRPAGGARIFGARARSSGERRLDRERNYTSILRGSRLVRPGTPSCLMSRFPPHLPVSTRLVPRRWDRPIRFRGWLASHRSSSHQGPRERNARFGKRPGQVEGGRAVEIVAAGGQAAEDLKPALAGDDLAPGSAARGVGPGAFLILEHEEVRDDLHHVRPVVGIVGLDDEEPRRDKAAVDVGQEPGGDDPAMRPGAGRDKAGDDRGESRRPRPHERRRQGRSGRP